MPIMPNEELPTLMVISDSPMKNAFFKKHLQDEFHFIKCESEKEALAQLKTTNITLIVIDEKTYGLSIFTLCQALREFPGYEEVPILVITAQLKKNYIRKLINAGASDFLREPLTAEDVYQRFEIAKRYHKTHKKIAQLTIPKQTPSTFGETALKAVANAQEKKEKITMLMLQIDGFDALVHHSGEVECEKLRLTVRKDIEKLIRNQDSLTSMGHGKYILILPNTSKSAGRHIAEEIKNTIYENRYGEHRLTLSIGLVTEDEGKAKRSSASQDLNGMLKQVTKSLDLAKKQGNQIISKEES